MKNVMVLNMGLKSIRCIVFNDLGVKLSSAAIAINTAINDECVEQDPAEWWEKAEKVMKKVIIECKNINIDYITVTASASCLVCVDKLGNPLGRAFMVSDKRAGKESEYISRLKEFQDVRDETGLEMKVSLMLPKILWVKNHAPDMFAKTYKFLTPNDYVLHMLSGEYVTDDLNAMKYHYDIEKKSYPEKLLQMLQIPIDSFPNVVDMGVTVSKIRPDLARKIGTSENTEIVVTSYDAICSFVGSGVSEDGEASDVSGTVTVFRALVRGSNKQKTTRVYSIPFCMEDALIVGGSNNLGGGLIEWVKQCYYQNEVYPYEVMEKDARESTIGARGLVFLPYLLGERTPVWNDDARGVFFGIERMHTRKDMTRAVFESTGFIDMDMISAIEETGTRIKSVRLSGGLARINLINQIKADILGRDVLVLSEFETTSTGAAMLALIGKGVFGSVKEASEKFCSVRMIIKPNMNNHEKYMDMYELYKDTYKTVEKLYITRKRIVNKIGNDREVQIENL